MNGFAFIYEDPEYYEEDVDNEEEAQYTNDTATDDVAVQQ